MSRNTNKTWKDLVEGPLHSSFSRRDFLARGLATGFMSAAVPKLLIGDWIRNAEAATTCPTPVMNPGAIAQIYASGGPTMGSRFLSYAQISAMNTTMAANYGVNAGTGANFVGLGPLVSQGVHSYYVDGNSVFGAAILAGPPGYPQGSFASSAAAWQANVLAKCTVGGQLGPFNSDDAVGDNSGIVGGFSKFKNTSISKDLFINNSASMASWSLGTPHMRASGTITAASLEAPLALKPVAGTFTSQAEFTNAANGAVSIAQALSGVFNTATRKACQPMVTSAGCSFQGNIALTNSAFAASLFDPTTFASSFPNITIAGLSPEEQALIAAYYQSGKGVLGGIVTQFNGRDYHGKDPQAVIAPADLEDARSIVMFLAACEAAGHMGSLIYNANGQAVASGVQPVTLTINGTALNAAPAAAYLTAQTAGDTAGMASAIASSTLNAPIAMGDAGGHYNGGFVVFFDPAGSPPTTKFNFLAGSLLTDGSIKMDPGVGSAQAAIAGLYLSALKWINVDTSSAQNAMLAAVPSLSKNAWIV